MSEFQLTKLHEDGTHSDKAFINFKENSTHQAAMISWLQNGFIVAKLSERFDVKTGEELRTLGIGSGEGGFEYELLSSLHQKFPRISNYVVEPSENHIIQYKRCIESKALQGVTFSWNMETIQTFRHRRETDTDGNTNKFHFISALNSLYYVDDLGKWLDYLYDDLLEDGGILVVILTSDTGGQGHLNKEYLLHDWWYNTNHVTPSLTTDNIKGSLLHSSAVDHFKTRGIQHHDEIIRCQCGITECFDTTNPTPKSDLLLDFFSNIINFRQNVDNKVFKQFLDVLGSDVCSDRRNGKVLFNSDYGVTIVTKE